MTELEKIYHWETSWELRTLWQLLQDVVEEDDNYYSLIEFLLDSTEEDRKRIEQKLAEADQKQFLDYMNGYTFVNRDEVYCAVSEYYETVMDRPLSMGECGDMSEIADGYIADKGLKFENDED